MPVGYREPGNHESGPRPLWGEGVPTESGRVRGFSRGFQSRARKADSPWSWSALPKKPLCSSTYMKPSREIEIKLKVNDPGRLKQRLKQMGFRRTVRRVRERNILFDFPDSRLFRSGRALRLRSAGGKHWLTLKGPASRSQKYKIRAEIETAVADSDRMITILEELHLRRVFAYEKRRTTYAPPLQKHRDHPPLLVFDETRSGNYVELEGPRNWIDRVAHELGFSKKDYVTASYIALLGQPGRLATAETTSRRTHPSRMKNLAALRKP
jgi:adenylate cyclase, class 2